MRIKGMVWYTLVALAFFAGLLELLFPAIRPSHIAAWYKHLGSAPSNFLWGWIGLLLVALLVYLKWGWRAYKTVDQTTSAATSLVPDSPISEEAQDEFKRGHFAEVMARALLLPAGSPSIVIGIEGAWGCGKSSLLALIEKCLLSLTPKPIVVHFNPWILGAVSDLVDSFFSQLADECAAQGAAPTLVSALDSVRREVERDKLSGVSRLAIQVWEFGSRIVRNPSNGTDILSRKQSVSRLLDSLSRPVVVLVDDVDRLAPDKIQAVFQLIKAVGDFNRVGYLVAYDPGPTLAALEFGQKTGFGKEYKDKIVQVVVPFPRDPYSERKLFLENLFNLAVERWSVSVSVQGKVLLAETLPIVLRSVHTPRQAKKIVNEAFLHAQLLEEEIALADLLVLSALSTRFPELVHSIRKQPTIVTGDALLDEEYISADSLPFIGKSASGKEKEDALQVCIDQSLSDGTERSQARALLWFLFRDRPSADTTHLNRLRDKNNFRVMLYGGVRGGLFSNADGDRLLYSASERDSLLDEYQLGDALAAFLYFATTRLNSEQRVDALLDLLQSIVRRARDLYSEQLYEIAPDVGRFVEAILLKSGAPIPEKHQALGTVVLEISFLSPGHELLVRVLRYIGAWDQGVRILAPRTRRGSDLDWLTDAQADALTNEWIALVESTPVELLMRRESGPIGILHRWGQLKGDNYGSVQNAFTAWISKDPKNVIMFSERFPGGISFSGSEKLVSPEFDLVKAFKDAPVPERQIERLLEDCPALADRAEALAENS